MEFLESDVRTWLKYPKTGVYYVIIPGTDGRWKSSGRTDEKAAIRWALTRARGDVTDSPTVAEFGKTFYLRGKCDFVATREDDEDGPRVARYWQDNRQVLVDYVMARWGNWQMDGVMADDFHLWLLNLHSVRDPSKKLSSRVRKRVRDVALDLWNWAVFKRAIKYNQLLSTPKIKPRYEKRRRFTDAERAAMFPEDLGIWRHGRGVVSLLRPAWGVAAMLDDEGMRPQETLALYWEDYRWDRKAWIVHRALNEEGEGDLKGTATKGIKAKAVPMSDRLDALLQVGRGLTGPVFQREVIGADGKPTLDFLRVDTFGKVFCRTLDRAGIQRDGRTLYSLRHGSYTRTVTEEGDAAAQSRHGHTSGQLKPTYDDPDEEDLLLRVGR